MSLHPRGAWTRKPLSHVVPEPMTQHNDGINNNNNNNGNRSSSSLDSGSERHLSLWDLVSIGVGGTVGSGIFVLAGLIAHDFSGPSTCLSFVLSGLAALCSGVAYAEWAGRLPAAGSTYVFALVSLGEWPAVLAAACLTLEYGVSGAAVARSWGDKLMEWMGWESSSSSVGNLWAGLITLLSVLLLSVGVQESKAVTNVMTVLKVALVLFMMVGGFLLWDVSNLQPFAPKGVAGTLRGATSSFFAFLGYDEVCCLAAEARNPSTDMPKAVLYTIAIVTVLYGLASLALVGMVPMEQISETSGFPAAFAARGVEWAAHVTAMGEIITLPVVVLISLMAQPRLFAAMARDGLLPEIFERQNADGNLVWSHWLCGIPMTLVATFVPFTYLDDGISVGILLLFNMTNSSLILMKCRDDNGSLSRYLILFHVTAFAAALVPRSIQGIPAVLASLATIVGLAVFIHCQSVRQEYFGAHLSTHGGTSTHRLSSTTRDEFETPMVPLVPLLGIAMNWYLIAQLEWTGLFLLFVYLGLVSALYFFYCSRMTLPWGYDTLEEEEHELEINRPIMLRELSLPKR